MDTTLSLEQIEAINRVIAKVLSVELPQITPDARFVEDLGADSLSIVELVLALEDHFNITIPDEISEQCATVAALYDAIAALVPRL